ncbi:MAG: hypothetical protein V8R40_03190 [Dysosmobacter sp.]
MFRQKSEAARSGARALILGTAVWLMPDIQSSTSVALGTTVTSFWYWCCIWVPVVLFLACIPDTVRDRLGVMAGLAVAAKPVTMYILLR